jgi:hypothetical protein
VTYPDGAVVSDRGYDDSGVYELHYIPGPEEHDPQLTVVTVSHGRVSALERRKIVAPAPGVPPSPPAIGREVAPSDIEIRRERAQRTLEAAEEYAHVRARIKERGVEAAPGAGGTVYRDTGGEGDAYFGDVPLPAGSKGEE